MESYKGKMKKKQKKKTITQKDKSEGTITTTKKLKATHFPNLDLSLKIT